MKIIMTAKCVGCGEEEKVDKNGDEYKEIVSAQKEILEKFSYVDVCVIEVPGLCLPCKMLQDSQKKKNNVH